jgi:hypothetical protein
MIKTIFLSPPPGTPHLTDEAPSGKLQTVIKHSNALCEGNIMNRPSLFILCVMILTPIFSFGMDPSQYPNVTADKEVQITHDDQPYTLFLYRGHVYGYQSKKDDTLDIFDTLGQFPNCCLSLPQDKLNTLRHMAQQCHVIKEACEAKKKNAVSMAGIWLSKDIQTHYEKNYQHQIFGLEAALDAALAKGGGGTTVYEEALNQEKGLDAMYQDIMSQTRTAKMKFYGLCYGGAALATALGLFGIYKLSQWWHATSEDADKAEDEETAVKKESLPA